MHIRSTIIILFSFNAMFMSAQSSLHDIFEKYDNYQVAAKEKNKISWPIKNADDIITELEFLNSVLTDLKQSNIDSISTTNRINVEMLQFIIENDILSLTYGEHLMPLSSEGGFIISMLYDVRGKSLNSKEAIETYIQKLNTTSLYLDQQIEWMNQGLNSNIVRPKLVVQNCIDLLDDILSKDTLFLFEPLRDKHELDPHYENEIFKAFRRLREYLQSTYLPQAPQKIGIRENLNGKTYYEQKIKYYTTLNMTPYDVYNKGVDEVKRIKKEMQDVINALHFDGSFEDFILHLRTDSSFYAQTPKEILYYAAWLSKKAEEILPQYFNKLPRLPFTVNPVPDAIAPNYTTGRYSGGSFKNHKSGEYWVNTYNLSSRPLYVLPALTLHEAVPGHHLQISLADELIDLPKFRSQYLSAFGEGWGLYSEYLGKEAGIYKSLYEEFGRLTYEMWRACRLVVDPGMHYFGMTKEEAVDFMKSNTSLSLHEINTEINRYIGWPGQAVSYKIGELKIRELRTLAEKILGDNFNIRDFHDLVIANGSIPLNTLERIINNYIKDQKIDVKKN